MLFREALRNDPSLVQKYNEVKLHNEMLEAAQYPYAKAKFIKAVLRDA
jgi:GrpB-like predicted nucleotidyltransferase (UPF0157 family)